MCLNAQKQALITALQFIKGLKAVYSNHSPFKKISRIKKEKYVTQLPHQQHDDNFISFMHKITLKPLFFNYQNARR
jgi:uncharacterized membrane protein YcgQ (UPF0703/DUF1980 family)